MANRGLAQTVVAPGASETATRGSLAVSSVPMFLLEQHRLIDEARDEEGGWVLAYRRLLSHIEFEGALVQEALLDNGRTAEAEEADRLMLDFRARKSPFGSAPEFMPLDDNRGMYRLRVGNGPWSFVHGGNDLSQAINAMMTPAREYDFERAFVPVSGWHTQLHRWLARVKLMKFDSAYSNTAQPHSQKSIQEGAERADELMAIRARAEELANGKKPASDGETAKPSGPTRGYWNPDGPDEG
ncbi:MAG: hypothetical protein WCB19_05780 [Thermoplasmata archaeon]